MTKKEETSVLKQIICKAHIYQTLDLLERQLGVYRRSEAQIKKLYSIHQEFDAILKELADLKSRIDNLTAED